MIDCKFSFRRVYGIWSAPTVCRTKTHILILGTSSRFHSVTCQTENNKNISICVVYVSVSQNYLQKPRLYANVVDNKYVFIFHHQLYIFLSSKLYRFSDVTRLFLTLFMLQSIVFFLLPLQQRIDWVMRLFSIICTFG